MDRDEQRKRRQHSSLPESLHRHRLVVPPLRSTLESEFDESTASQEAFEGSEGGGYPQRYPSSPLPVPHAVSSLPQPQHQQGVSRHHHHYSYQTTGAVASSSSLSLAHAGMYGGEASGGGGVAARGMMAGGTFGRSIPSSSTVGSERSYDLGEAGGPSEHYPSSPYIPSSRHLGSYDRTQTFDSDSTGHHTTHYASPDTYSFPPPPPPPSYLVQRPSPTSSTSLPPIWSPSDDPNMFHRMPDFATLIDASRQDEWRAVTAEEARGRSDQPHTPIANAYVTRPRSRLSAPQFQHSPARYLSPRQQQQQLEASYLEHASRTRSDYRSGFYVDPAYRGYLPFDPEADSRFAESSVSTRSYPLGGSPELLLSRDLPPPEARPEPEPEQELQYPSRLPLPYSDERTLIRPPTPPHGIQQPVEQSIEYLEPVGGSYPSSSTGNDSLGLQSLSTPSLFHTSPTRPLRSLENESSTDDSAEKSGPDVYSEMSKISREKLLGSDSGLEDDVRAPSIRSKRTLRKTVIACNFCRGRKLKCDGQTPTCRNCDKRYLPCIYQEFVRRRGPGKAPRGSRKRGKAAVLKDVGENRVTPESASGAERQPPHDPRQHFLRTVSQPLPARGVVSEEETGVFERGPPLGSSTFLLAPGQTAPPPLLTNEPEPMEVEDAQMGGTGMNPGYGLTGQTGVGEGRREGETSYVTGRGRSGRSGRGRGTSRTHSDSLSNLTGTLTGSLTSPPIQRERDVRYDIQHDPRQHHVHPPSSSSLTLAAAAPTVAGPGPYSVDRRPLARFSPSHAGLHYRFAPNQGYSPQPPTLQPPQPPLHPHPPQFHQAQTPPLSGPGSEEGPGG